MPAGQHDDLRAGTVTARVNLLFEAFHDRGEQPCSHADMATKVTEETGVALSATQLEQVRSGDETAVTSEQLAALAQTFGVAGEYFGDEQRAQSIDSQLDLLRTLRDANSEIGCIRGGLASTPAARDQIRDLVRWVEAEEARKSEASTTEVPAAEAELTEQSLSEAKTPAQPTGQHGRRGWWQRLTSRRRPR